ncbi:hypothetical protein [Mesorhizobium sp.]|uniref:hypothetical protein n=1 Tax=Mesorhizobium sp. TaxID=1871066 RepID=UPI00257DE8FB|nr:hypothetical protein [Mesorhizobium sp.]
MLRRVKWLRCFRCFVGTGAPGSVDRPAIGLQRDQLGNRAQRSVIRIIEPEVVQMTRFVPNFQDTKRRDRQWYQ